MKTYGTLEYIPATDTTGKKKAKRGSAPIWHIRCVPHVAIRIKHALPKLVTEQRDVLTLTATPENSRDLEWFMLRYPLEIRSGSEVPLKTLSDQHREKESLVDQMLRAKQVINAFKLKLDPREYQVVAAQLWHLVEGLLLADAVGVGKTISAITGFSDPARLPAMVVCPTALPVQWKEQIERCTDLVVHILKKGTPYDITAFHDGRFPDVIVSPYSKIRGWKETLAPLIVSLVFDEIQHLRRVESDKYKAAYYLSENAQYTIGLSATPIYNYGGEIFNVVDAIKSGCLGTRDEFYREWCTALNNGKYKVNNPEALSAYLSEAGLMLRRTRKDVGRELPPLEIITHYVDANPKALLAVKNKATSLAKLILQSTEEFRGQKRQASSQFDLEVRQATGIAKAPYVAEFVKLLHADTGEKIVVFAWHRAVYDILLEELKDLKPVMYTGSESPKQKAESLKAFIEGDSQVILISLRSGEGVDGLQHASHIAVLAELDWAPGVIEQDIGRVFRDGQLEPVLAYCLLCSGGSDGVMSDVLGIKRQQLEGLINPGNENQVTELEVDPEHVRKLAQRYLKDQGIALPLDHKEPLHGTEIQ